jgi:hypothetical protein
LFCVNQALLCFLSEEDIDADDAFARAETAFNNKVATATAASTWSLLPTPAAGDTVHLYVARALLNLNLTAAAGHLLDKVNEERGDLFVFCLKSLLIVFKLSTFEVILGLCLCSFMMVFFLLFLLFCLC